MRVFNEEQKITKGSMHMLLTIGAIIPTFIIIKEWINATDKSISANLSSFIAILIIILVHIFIYSAKLKTRIDEFGIHYQFFPFHFSYKKIAWTAIENRYIRSYSPISEYCGWGLRYTFSKKKGNALNVSGNIGIQIELKNGKKLLIGTNKKEEAKRVLATYKNKNENKR